MTKSPIGAACACILVALAGGLATPTASHAAVYGGAYDPENANYRWFGNHLFAVADACLVGDGWKRVNSDLGYGGCGSAQLIGGDLTVVNKLGTPSLLDDVSRTLLFSNFPFIPTSLNPLTAPVWGVNIVGGELVGVDSFEIGSFTFAAADAGTHGGDWFLRWSSGRGAFCDLYSCGGRTGEAAGEPADPLAVARPTVFLTNRIAGDPNGLVPLASDRVTFQRVPEPGTVALVLAALGACWVSRRRRQP